MDPFLDLLGRLAQHRVRFVLIGVWGANLYARGSSQVFTTLDRDLLLPPESSDVQRAWASCEAAGFSLWVGSEPLDVPRDSDLADRIVDRRAMVRAHHEMTGLDVDLTLEIAGFGFEAVWRERRIFTIEGHALPVARLAHIVQSKAAAGREKDRLFLATHAEALRAMLERE